MRTTPTPPFLKYCWIILPLLLSSCDGWYSYKYQIKNETNDIVKIKIKEFPTYIYDLDNPHQHYTRDSIYILSPKSLLTLEIDGGLCGYRYRPYDLRDYRAEHIDHLLIDYITEIIIDDKSVSPELWDSNKWKFTSKKLLGLYFIKINSSWKNYK